MVRNKLRWEANNAVRLSNKEKPGRTGKSSFVLEVSLRYLRPSIIYSAPRDRIVQRAGVGRKSRALYGSHLLFF